MTGASQTTIRYAHVGSEGDIQHWYGEEFAKRVNDRSDGRILVQVFPNSQLGGAQETVDGVRSGAIPLAHHEFASLANLMPEMGAFAAPFIYRDGTHAMAATDPQNSEVMQEMNERMAEEVNIRIIGRLYRGARQMTANKAVYSPDDLAGERFRGVPLQLWTLGTAPTGAQLHEALAAHYAGIEGGFVELAPLEPLERSPELDPTRYNGSNRMKLHVFANDDRQQALLVAVYDNLGKGASGAAVQNLNLMLGFPEDEGL